MFEQDKLCFVYNGVFNDNITDKVIALAEQNVSRFDELTKLRKKVSFLIVECFQNVVRHGESKPSQSDPRGCFSTRYDGNANHISAVNLIHPSRIPQLQELLQSINNMNSENLKELYRKILAEPEMTGRGAGLGLIEMARKSGQQLNFDFEKTQKELSNFYLSIKLKNEKASKPVSNPLSISKDLYAKLNSDNISLLYKGEYTQDTIYPITYIAQNRSAWDHDGAKGKRVFNTLVDMLQDINKSMEEDDRSEGILILTKTDAGAGICAGTPVSEQRMKELSSFSNLISSLSPEDLDKYYEKKLALGSNEQGSELSLVTLARRSATPIRQELIPMKNGRYFYSLHVTV